MSKKPRKIYALTDQTVGAVHTFPVSKTYYQRQADGSLRRVYPKPTIGEQFERAQNESAKPAQGATNP